MNPNNRRGHNHAHAFTHFNGRPREGQDLVSGQNALKGATTLARL